MTDNSDKPTITAYPNGPLIVRGDVTILSADGEPVPRRRRTVALCRCGASTIKPFCDGTHRITGFCTEEPEAWVRAPPPGDPSAPDASSEAPWNSEVMSEPTTPSEKPYDPAKDPDADPEELESKPPRPSQAEGEDDATAQPQSPS
ncbi:CDGSH iron-sulfur domain-containing protein [Georgenia sunbinii]|uniref:CDGSH iron-sulfur domain-containing protein n=1 Tax=Georgenia sunbinii TaxID=3117728 RepID=UPI002F268C67